MTRHAELTARLAAARNSFRSAQGDALKGTGKTRTTARKRQADAETQIKHLEALIQQEGAMTNA